MTTVTEAITVADFKGYFTRDFKYAPAAYIASKAYFLGDIVSYVVSGTTNYYQLKVATSIGVVPTNTTNWSAYNLVAADYILDSDITKALAQGVNNVNPDIFESDAVLTDAFYYAAAHFLVMDIRMAEAGLDSRNEGVITNKSVGSVSVGYGTPADTGASALQSFYQQTAYGQKYMAYVRPRTIGHIGIAYGAVTA